MEERETNEQQTGEHGKLLEKMHVRKEEGTGENLSLGLHSRLHENLKEEKKDTQHL